MPNNNTNETRACDRRAYTFNFNHQFEIHDDLEVLRRMGMTYGLERGCCDAQNFNTLIKLMPTAVHRILTGQFHTLKTL